ncbi:MAG: hypothetical protein JJE40_02420 [Vicinamibacteria bacterium]|nr:hypothetical protein [Vicinamibacteria bacterium]
MSKTRTRFSLLLFAISLPASAPAQSLPTSQPSLLRISREEVKPGRAADHAKIEAGWPAAYEKAKSPDYYLAIASITGTNEVWYLSPYASHDAQGASMARDEEPALAAELARLSRADGELLTGIRHLQARARLDLSYGTYPDLAKMRFWEITTFRVRPGHERHFTEAAKAYVAASGRAGSKSSFRTYEVIAGAVGSTYLIFSSVASFAEFDQTMGTDEAVMKAATADEGSLLQKFMSEGVITVETQRFRLDPVQSYVSKEVRATDPAFWMPKKPAAAKPAASQP